MDFLRPLAWFLYPFANHSHKASHRYSELLVDSPSPQARSAEVGAHSTNEEVSGPGAAAQLSSSVSFILCILSLDSGMTFVLIAFSLHKRVVP